MAFIERGISEYKSPWSGLGMVIDIDGHSFMVHEVTMHQSPTVLKPTRTLTLVEVDLPANVFATRIDPTPTKPLSEPTDIPPLRRVRKE